jgi:lysophospholipase L1-like esterase
MPERGVAMEREQMRHPGCIASHVKEVTMRWIISVFLTIVLFGCGQDNQSAPSSQYVAAELSVASPTGQYNIVGDSIAANGYLRYYMKSYAPDITFTGSLVDIFGYRHDSVPGATTAYVINRLGAVWDSDNYIVMIGTNDIAFGVPMSVFHDRLKTIVANLRARRPDTNVYVCTILPRMDDFGIWVPYYNLKVKQVVMEFEDPQVILIDTYKKYTSYYYWWDTFPDKLHPNIYGYMILAQSLVQDLR